MKRDTWMDRLASNQRIQPSNLESAATPVKNSTSEHEAPHSSENDTRSGSQMSDHAEKVDSISHEDRKVVEDAQPVIRSPSLLSPLRKAVTTGESVTSIRRRLDQPSQTRTSMFLARTISEVPASESPNRNENYLLKVCRALMMYGAPTHRLEEYMHMTAEVLELPLQSFYMPGCMIVSFSDRDWRSTEVRIVRCTQSLNLAKLYDVHNVYKEVIHDRCTVDEAITGLDEIMNAPDKYHPWLRVLMYGIASACIGPVSYNARPIDLPFIFLLGAALGCMELIVAPRSELYAHVFEISSAILISFLARAIGSIRSGRFFCFSAIAQASVVMILPGFTITTAALELQSKNIVSGSVRMVYSIIYVLFLAFGFNVGITVYGAIDDNATSAIQCDKPWPFWWQVTFVAPFTFFWIMVNNGQWRKMPAMVVVTMAGWLVNHFSALHFTSSPEIAQALGALTAGVFANLYSRLSHGFAVGVLHPAIFIQVPGSFAATGSLISGVTSADQTNSRGQPLTGNGTTTSLQVNATILTAGYAMVEIAIAITVGLSVGVLLIYPFRNTKGKSGIFSF